MTNRQKEKLSHRLRDGQTTNQYPEVTKIQIVFIKITGRQKRVMHYFDDLIFLPARVKRFLAT